jgi:hypothetical protein
MKQIKSAYHDEKTGRTYHTIRFDSEKEANEFLDENKQYGVIGFTNERLSDGLHRVIHVSKNSDAGDSYTQAEHKKFAKEYLEEWEESKQEKRDEEILQKHYYHTDAANSFIRNSEKMEKSKIKAGDEGMYEGSEVRVIHINGNGVAIQNIDQEGKEIEKTFHRLSLDEFAKSFSKFPKNKFNEPEVKIEIENKSSKTMLEVTDFVEGDKWLLNKFKIINCGRGKNGGTRIVTDDGGKHHVKEDLDFFNF